MSFTQHFFRIQSIVLDSSESREEEDVLCYGVPFSVSSATRLMQHSTVISQVFLCVITHKNVSFTLSLRCNTPIGVECCTKMTGCNSFDKEKLLIGFNKYLLISRYTSGYFICK